MEKLEANIHLTKFEFDGKTQTVGFVETMDVAKGVKCDVYKFIDDDSKDLGIIKIEPGSKTPPQKVLKGERTVEGYVSGAGKLVITKTDGSKEEYKVKDGNVPILVNVEIGETMQWEASPNSRLVASEICLPPYKDGRYENLPFEE